MAIFILPREEQVESDFNNGEIFENKPLGFPNEGGVLKPYSNLFYWANAWSDKGSLLKEHRHQGFEILSFVLQGKIEHFDNKSNIWTPLTAGDVQILFAGKGINHAENFFPGSRIFQIWFDPGVQKNLKMEPNYNNFKSELFPTIEYDNFFIKVYKGENAPIHMFSEKVEIFGMNFKKGLSNIKINPEKIYSGYLITGSILINGYVLKQDDFFIAQDEEIITIEANTHGNLFIVATPAKISYKTYFQIYLK